MDTLPLPGLYFASNERGKGAVGTPSLSHTIRPLTCTFNPGVQRGKRGHVCKAPHVVHPLDWRKCWLTPWYHIRYNISRHSTSSLGHQDRGSYIWGNWWPGLQLSSVVSRGRNRAQTEKKNNLLFLQTHHFERKCGRFEMATACGSYKGFLDQQ